MLGVEVLTQPPGCWPVTVTVVRSSGTCAIGTKVELGCWVLPVRLYDARTAEIGEQVERAKQILQARRWIECAWATGPALARHEEAYALMEGRAIGSRDVGQRETGAVKNILKYLIWHR